MNKDELLSKWVEFKTWRSDVISKIENSDQYMNLVTEHLELLKKVTSRHSLMPYLQSVEEYYRGTQKDYPYYEMSIEGFMSWMADSK